MDKRAASSRESTPRSPAAAPAERPYAGGYLDDRSPAGDKLRAFVDLSRDGPRAVAQRRAVESMFGPAAQRSPPRAAPQAEIEARLDDGLEAPAEMAEPARQVPLATPPVSSDAGAVVQAKLEIAGTEKRLKELLRTGGVDGLHRQVLSAIDANRPMLEPLFEKVKGPSLAEIRAELNRPLAFENNLHSLAGSPVDYGEINLANPQHVYLYVKEAGRFLNVNYIGNEASDVLDEKQKEEKRLEKAGPGGLGPKAASPGSREQTFQVALLGKGASVADYINVHGTAMDPKTTVVIGESQPWRPSKDDPRSRGIEFVNHPRNMTSTRREETHLPKDESGKDETFLGNAAQLSGDIDFVIKRFGAKDVPAKIDKVKRLDSGWYHIKTSEGDVYAQKVVSGLGIGPHKFEGQNKRSKEVVSEGDKALERDRVLDLDAFQRAAGDPESPMRKAHARKPITIGVSGPNAGTDAVHIATQLGMFVDWVVSADGPAIAEGMGNKIGRVGLVEVYFDYLNGWTFVAPGYIQLDISGKWPDRRNPDNTQDRAEKGFLEKQPGWAGRLSRAKSVLVDYLVIAQGPDVAKLWNVFDASATKDLELKDDRSGRFGAHSDDKTAWQGSVQNSLSSSGYNIRFVGIERALEPIFKAQGAPERYEVLAAIRDDLLAQALRIVDVPAFAPITLQSGAAARLASKDDSFEIIGGSAVRILNYLDMEANQATAPEALKGRDKEARMKQVLKTLPTPTILNNDQLTPIRSQIEASGDYMPGYVGTGESNFVTDDQTMIAAQIASEYPRIPGELANWMTQKIIEDRHKRGVKPGTSSGSRAFVDLWKGKLRSLDGLFEVSRLSSLVADGLARK